MTAAGTFAEKYGPWAVIAGGSDGTGAAFAEELAARGVRLVLVARRQPVLDALAARLDVETRTVSLDLGFPDAANHLADAAGDLEVGTLIWNCGADSINAASTAPRGPCVGADRPRKVRVATTQNSG